MEFLKQRFMKRHWMTGVALLALGPGVALAQGGRAVAGI
jgi:hypothetical protein